MVFAWSNKGAGLAATVFVWRSYGAFGRETAGITRVNHKPETRKNLRVFMRWKGGAA
jgi:hypothetical protein